MTSVRFDSNFDKVAAVLSDGVMDGLVDAAEFLLTESRAVVPIDEATLERSGVASQDRSSMTVAVSYDTPYAVVQHENLEYQHAPGRQAKYLENPANEHRATMETIVAVRAREALREG